MIVVVNKFVPFNGFSAISLWPFVFLKNPQLLKDPVFLNHEKIHLRQQIEMLILPFYMWYLLEFLLRCAKTGDSKIAYRSISFEVEAYEKESDLSYLKNRKNWSFLTYL